VFLNHRALPFAVKQNRLTGSNALLALGQEWIPGPQTLLVSIPGGATTCETVVEGTSRFVAGLAKTILAAIQMAN
jgi:hypothetical protein